jgi:hypothetical protein
MVCRSLENSIFLASVNCALPHQEAATSVITPDGERLANLAYREPCVHLVKISPNAAKHLYASKSQTLFYGSALPIRDRAKQRKIPGCSCGQTLVNSVARFSQALQLPV